MPPLSYPLISLVFLAAISLVLVAAAIGAFLRARRYNIVERLLYLPVYSLARLLWRVELHWDPRWTVDPTAFDGKEPEKRMLLRDRMEQGAVLVANHRASIDPFFIQLAAGCRVHWMVAGEYFAHPLFGGLLRSFQAIPTKRGGADNAATKQAIRLAASGKFVGMFPEGRINRTEAPLLSVRPGAALVAAKSNTPIIPIWIEGAPTGPQIYSPFFKSAHVRVHIGYPVPPPVSLCATDLTRREVEPSRTESGEQNLDGEQLESEAKPREGKDKTIYLSWITEAMQDSLRLGRCENPGIEHAGRSWLNS